jgi:hypothetical protein
MIQLCKIQLENEGLVSKSMGSKNDDKAVFLLLYLRCGVFNLQAMVWLT